jgi:hypothetical protein
MATASWLPDRLRADRRDFQPRRDTLSRLYACGQRRFIAVGLFGSKSHFFEGQEHMRKLIALALGGLIAATAPAQAVSPADAEAKLAKALEGRVAGEPVKCINLRLVRSTEIIDDTGILYDTGRTVYLNRPRAGADSLDRWDTLVTKLHSSELCSIDTVQLYDSASRMQTGFVFLGEFVPYRKAD